MPPPDHVPQILVVDDDEGLLVLMAETLRAEGHAVATAASGSAALQWIDAHPTDLMLLDLKMRDLDGPTLLAKLQAGTTRVPFIVVTGQGDEKVAVEVMKRGALDYVMKDTALLDLLPAVVRRTLDALAQARALAAAQAEHLDAIHLGHADVEQEQVGSVVAAHRLAPGVEEKVQNCLPVTEMHDGVLQARHLQVLPDEDGVAFVVFDDQDRGRLFHAWSRRPGSRVRRLGV